MSLAALQAALGADGVELHEPRSLEGASLEASLRPRDGEALAAALAALSDAGLPALVQGAGTRAGLGNPCPAARVLLSTGRISGIDELDADDGVVHVRAGTSLAEVTRAAGEAGWELPFDPPGATTTVGGAIAAAATGPRRLRFGAPRDSVLGLEVVLASGERTRCGGRVVKNVTGYDMAKLYAGCFGSLGVIEGAWLRLRPRPRSLSTAVVALPGGDPGPPLELAFRACRRPSARVVALVTGAPAARLGAPIQAEGTWVLVVEYAGEPAAVERDAAWLRDEAGAREVPEASRLVGRLRDLQGSGDLRVRLSVLPSRLPAVLAPLVRSGLGSISYPGIGVVYAFSDDGAKPLLEAAQASGGDVLFEALPLDARRDLDVFGDPGPTLPILRALKQRFDPAGILNPGRFQGRL